MPQASPRAVDILHSYIYDGVLFFSIQHQSPHKKQSPNPYSLFQWLNIPLFQQLIYTNNNKQVAQQ